MNILNEIKEIGIILFNEEARHLDDFSENESEELLSRIERVVLGEQGDDAICFFNNENLFSKLIYLGARFKGNDKIIELLASIFAHQIRYGRYHGFFDLNYNWLFENKSHHNKKVRYIVAYNLHKYPSFQEKWDGKWDYILSIAKVAPKKFTKDAFIWSIYKNKDGIPNEYIPKLKKELEKILEKATYVNETQMIHYKEISESMGVELEHFGRFENAE